MLVVLATLAFADVAPPPDYVEACAVEKACPRGAEARSCEGSFQGRAECEALEASGWSSACRTRGASVWTEVMCKPGAAGTTPAPGGEGGGCAARRGLLLFGVFALLFGQGRRARRITAGA